MPHQRVPASVLVVEDEFLIGSEVADLLCASGVSKVHHANDLTSALAAIAEQSWDMVILDLELGGQSGLPIAELALAAGSRLVFHTGYPSAPQGYEHVPLLLKPATEKAIRQMILSGAVEADVLDGSARRPPE